ncbi:putative transmembrane family 234 protein [Helianthus debilis subsp. tardiflorus]
MVIRDIEKMVTAGLIWGATNALMRRGALISDQQLHNKQSSTKNPILKTLIDWFSLILVWQWQYSLPFITNLSASTTFFDI